MENIKINIIKRIIFILIIIPMILLFLTTNIRAGGPAAPSFTTVPYESVDPVDQGNPVTFTAIATDGNEDAWYLAICKSELVTGAVGAPPTCDGGDYCVSTSSAATGDPNNCVWTSEGSGEQIWYGFACDGSNQALCSAYSNANSPITVTAVDNTKPDINITFPINNTNWTNVNLDVNFTRSDDVALFNCWYSNDTYLANTSLTTNCDNVTNVVWSEGQHNVTVWANDTNGNINNSKISFRIDTTLPTVSDISVNDQNLGEEDVAENGFVATIDFSEIMNESALVEPTVVFDPAVATTLTNCDGTWTDSDTYTRTCDIEDGNIESAGVDIQVSGAKDLAGNTMDADTTTGIDEFNVDSIKPDITIVYPNNNTNWTNVNLDVNFTRSDTNLFNCWYSNDTYLKNTSLTTNCDNVTNVVWSEGQHNVTVWANDTNGNINNSKISFRIDTTLPTVSDISVNDQNLGEEDVAENGFVATIDFSEIMNESALVEPTVVFDPAVATTLTNCDGTWTDSDTYTWTCDIVDVDVIQADVDIQVSGAKDLAGNTMDADTTTGIDEFSIDTVTSNTCTPGAGDWVIDCSDNCIWDVALEVPADIFITGSGTLTLNAKMHLTSANWEIYKADGCEIVINSGGSIE